MLSLISFTSGFNLKYTTYTIDSEVLYYTEYKLTETGQKLFRCKVVKKVNSWLLSPYRETAAPFLLADKHLHNL